MAKKLKVRTKDKDQERPKHFNINIFTVIVILLIILTFVITGSSWQGIINVIENYTKKKEKNDDGTYSIQEDAQVSQNSKNQDTYIGKVLGHKIKFGGDDDFNRAVYEIYNNKNLNPYQKYQYTRYYFDQEINKIIGMKKSQELDIQITSDSDFYIEEIGKRFYKDNDGDINYDYMKKHKAEVNRKGFSILKELIYEIFVRDNFLNLPISNQELLDNFKVDESGVRIKFINISNKDVDIAEILNYYSQNVSVYKKYKLIRLIFDKKETAEKILNDIKKDQSKFLEIGKKLKDENKAKLVYDPDYSFVNDFEEDVLRDAVKKTQNKKVYDKVVETKLGPIIFYVDDVKDFDFGSTADFNKIKNDYIQKNISTIENNNMAKAQAIYDYALKSNLEEAGKKFNLPVRTSNTYINFMENNYQNNMELYFDFESKDDINFMVSLFKTETGKVITPRKYSEGYMIAVVTDKHVPTYDDFVGRFDMLNDRYSRQKTAFLQKDYYDIERKKIEIIDNFKYSISPQMFIGEQTEQ